MEFNTSQYVVRLSDADTNNFLGSGTLFLNRGEVFLITCRHVIEPKEYAKPPDKILLTFRTGDACCVRRDSAVINDTEKDFCCFRLQRQRWMLPLQDTIIGNLGNPMDLYAIGYPELLSGEPKVQDAQRTIECNVSNVAPAESSGYFYCKLHHPVDRSMDEQLKGYSGSGLYAKDGLVGIVKGRKESREEVDLEFCGIPISTVLDALTRCRDVAEDWFEHGLIRRLSSAEDRNSRGNIPFFVNSMNVLNLWSLMLVLKKPILLVLLNRSPILKDALLHLDWLNQYHPTFTWYVNAQISEKAAILRLVEPSEQHAKRQEHLEYIRSWRRNGPSAPLLIHVDLTDQHPIPSIEQLHSAFKHFAGQDGYIFISENFFECQESLDLFQHKGISQEIHEQVTALDQRRFSDDLYSAYVSLLQKHSFEMDSLIDWLVERFDQVDRMQKLACFRLFVLYARITGRHEPLSRIATDRSLPILLTSVPIADRLYYSSYCRGIDCCSNDDGYVLEQLNNALERKNWVVLRDLLSEHDTAYWYLFSEQIGNKPPDQLFAFMKEISNDAGLQLLYLFLMMSNRRGFQWLCTLAHRVRSPALSLLPDGENDSFDQLECDNAIRTWKLIFDRDT